MITESQIAADMASAYQQQAAFEYMLAREIRDRGHHDAASKLQLAARKLSWMGRRYMDWVD